MNSNPWMYPFWCGGSTKLRSFVLYLYTCLLWDICPLFQNRTSGTCYYLMDIQYATTKYFFTPRIESNYMSTLILSVKSLTTNTRRLGFLHLKGGTAETWGVCKNSFMTWKQIHFLLSNLHSCIQAFHFCLFLIMGDQTYMIVYSFVRLLQLKMLIMMSASNNIGPTRQQFEL